MDRYEEARRLNNERMRKKRDAENPYKARRRIRRTPKNVEKLSKSRGEPSLEEIEKMLAENHMDTH